MQIIKAEFVTSIADIESYKLLPKKPEVVIAGRSNVGKSSFINMLTGRFSLAKVSQTPGHTKLVNIFDINDGHFNLIDLPGYGYAAAGRSLVKKWSLLIDNFLETSVDIKQVLLMVDIRRATLLDKQMMEYLYAHQLPFTVVATKADKLSRAAVARSVGLIASELGLGKDDIIVSSAVDGTGRDEVLDRLGRFIKSKKKS